MRAACRSRRRSARAPERRPRRARRRRAAASRRDLLALVGVLVLALVGVFALLLLRAELESRLDLAIDLRARVLGVTGVEPIELLDHLDGARAIHADQLVRIEL